MSVRRLAGIVAAVAALFFFVPVWGAGPTFRPDVTFQGSTFAGWHSLGSADWAAQAGEITGTPKAPGGGWLVLDRAYQDVGVYASFRCAPGCKTGVLLRAEKTPDGGLKGIFVSLGEAEVAPGEAPVPQTEQGAAGLASYALTLDAQGKELKRERLRRGGGQMRIAPPLDPNAAAGGRGAAQGRGGGRGGPPVPLPIVRPDTNLHPGDWNQVEILIDANIVRAFLNTFGSETAGGVAEDDSGRYGPVALYVGGTGEVHFKDLAYANLALKTRPAEQLSNHFRMQRLSDFYYAWGAGAADFNHDGVMDIVAGPHIYYGPGYLTHSEIYLAIANNPSDTYTTDDWMQFVGDFTGDGWPDVLNCSFSGNPGAWLYVNPKGESRRWDKHLVVTPFNTEIAVVKDLLGDGKLELVYGGGGTMRYARPDPANPTGPWIVRSVSDMGYSNAHGVGVGDINGDGRLDILNAYGWWEQPPNEAASLSSTPGSVPASWPYHPEAFGRYGRNGVGGSVMAAYDVNGDGLTDVVTSLNAHGFGLAWFEQKRDAQGTRSFVQHMIMDDYGTTNAGGVTFSEPHGTTVADMDGDGIPDFVVGKRFWSHRDDFLDPDPYGAAVLYYYKTVRNPKAPGGAEFVPELIHNQSGAGSDVLAVDLNKDGRMDLVTATRFGTFIFWGQNSASRSPR